MQIVCGFDVHRGQITFDVEDLGSGEVRRGRIGRPDRQRLRRWLTGFEGCGEVHFALEGCTGWRYVAEEVQAAGFVAHVAEPADAQALRGKKRRAKTDRGDARLLREALRDGRLPESWIPPAHVCEWRDRVRLYVVLVNQRSAWIQRIHAELFHHGVPAPAASLLSVGVREALADADLTPAARRRVAVAYDMIDAGQTEIGALGDEIRRFARRHPATKALMANHYGVGQLTAPAIWAEMGDCGRFCRSDQAVRHSGLDITVYSSDGKRSPGRIARQGPQTLRWALYEAAQCASKASSPDHDYYNAVKARHGPGRATLSVARKLARRCYHTLQQLGDQAMIDID